MTTTDRIGSDETMTTTTAQHGLTEHSHGGGSEAQRAGSAVHHRGSFDVADHPVPRGREEEWRFTSMARLRRLHDDAPLVDHDYDVAVAAADGVQVTTSAAAGSRRGSSGYVPADRVSARAWAAAGRVLTVTVPADAQPEDPTTIVVTGSGAAQATAAQVLVEVGANSRSTLVIEYRGSATVADNVEIVVGDGAWLTVVALQNWADDAVQVSHHHLRVGRDAHVKHVVVTFGGDLVRTSTSLDYAGIGGEAQLLGLYFVDEGQHVENRLFIDHNTPKARSNVEYKGALQGSGAHAVWVGDVLIRPEAEGISTYELNRNLLLTEGARADSVPNLEIETGEIEGAGHASATGRFDDEQLFYLQARGIPAEQAKRLVVRGFFASLINQIGVSDLIDRLMLMIEQELSVSMPEEVA